MINLHLHTNLSDGVLNPTDLLKKLESNGIKVASITDHDNVDAYLALRRENISDYYSGDLIQGTEMKCTYNGFSIEILGYYINVDYLKKYLDEKNKRVMDFQKYAFEIGKNICRDLKLKFDEEDLKSGQFAGTALYNALNKYYNYNVEILGPGIIDNGSVFYRKTFANPDSQFFVSEENLGFSAEDTVDKIHEVGGLAFLAHIGQYKMINDKLQFLNDIRKTNIDGIECYYSLHTEEETKKYLKFCKQNNLLISGGSDYHGTPSQNIICQDNINEADLNWVKTLRKN